jgi:hypothetical protein
MAGDWIKMRVDLASDPAVIRIRRATGLDADSVVGKLHRLWAWANTHLASGEAQGLDLESVDELAGAAGFAAALESAGWLRVDADGVQFVNFERHNGQPAKARALAKTRMERIRCAASATDAQQKRNQRREEKRRNTHTHTAAASVEISPPEPEVVDWAWFAAAWNETPRAAPWTLDGPPAAWAAYILEPGWLDRARLALARLPRCHWFDNSVAVTKFFEIVDEINAGQFDNPKSRPVVRGGRQPAGGNL